VREGIASGAMKVGPLLLTLQMLRRLRYGKGGLSCSDLHVETLHTQPPVIAPQCHQEPPSVEALYTQLQLPSPLPEPFQQTNEIVPHKLQASPIPQCFQESSEGAQRTLLPGTQALFLATSRSQKWRLRPFCQT